MMDEESALAKEVVAIGTGLHLFIFIGSDDIVSLLEAFIEQA